MAYDPEMTCFGRLMAIEETLATADPHVVTRAVNRVLGCGRRYSCRSHLACSWMAASLATRLIERLR